VARQIQFARSTFPERNCRSRSRICGAWILSFAYESSDSSEQAILYQDRERFSRLITIQVFSFTAVSDHRTREPKASEGSVCRRCWEIVSLISSGLSRGFRAASTWFSGGSLSGYGYRGWRGRGYCPGPRKICADKRPSAKSAQSVAKTQTPSASLRLLLHLARGLAPHKLRAMPGTPPLTGGETASERFHRTCRAACSALSWNNRCNSIETSPRRFNRGIVGRCDIASRKDGLAERSPGIGGQVG